MKFINSIGRNLRNKLPKKLLKTGEKQTGLALRPLFLKKYLKFGEKSCYKTKNVYKNSLKELAI